MAVEITGKFKPKNSGNFALMDAEDIEMPDGTRLSEFQGGVTSVNGQTGDVVITVTNGEDGKDGTNGKDGADGVSPTVTVTAITGGHRVTITDASGTKTFDVMDGEDGESASVTVDSALSTTSANPVQNKVVTDKINYLLQTLDETIMPRLMPEVTAADSGKILTVDANGAWAAVAMETWAGGDY